MTSSGKRTGLIFGGILAFTALLGLGIAAASGPAKKPDKPPPDEPDEPPANDKPANDKPANDKPANDKPGQALEFDLSNNWGVLPLDLRIWLARIELAAQIPGLARALGVKWWQAFRAGQPLVDLAAAAQIAAANPELCRVCFNPADAGASKKLLDNNLAQGWPKPADYEGWAAGSYGLGDILGASAVHAGIMTDKKKLPLLNLQAAPAMRRFDVQGFVAAAMIRQFLFSEKYSVLVPGPNAANGNSEATWVNIFAAWAMPDSFSKGSQAAKDAGERFRQRAKECGIDLAKVAYPWPPGKRYDVKHWTAQAVWTRLQEYAARPVYDKGGVVVPQPDPEPPLEEPAPQLGVLLTLPGGLKAAPRIQAVDDAPAPLVIVLHGREGDEQQLVDFVPPELTARIFFLRGNIPGSKPGTYSFFTPRLSDPDAVLLPAMKAALSNVLAALAQLQAQYPTTRVLAFGGSQGAALCYALAAVGAVDGVIGLSGALPPALRPTQPAATIVFGVHGSADQVVPIQDAGNTVHDFENAGYLFTRFVDIDGGGHSLTQAKPDVRQMLTELASDEFIAGETGIALTEACQIVVPAPPEAVWSISTRLTTLARHLRVQRGGKPLPKTDLEALIDTLITELAPWCALGGREFGDTTSARDGYLVFRAALRALQARGLLAAGVAAGTLGDFKQQAMTKGVPAASLPPLDL